jgi:hypothetical protein
VVRLIAVRTGTATAAVIETGTEAAIADVASRQASGPCRPAPALRAPKVRRAATVIGIAIVSSSGSVIGHGRKVGVMIVATKAGDVRTVRARKWRRRRRSAGGAASIPIRRSPR